MTQRRDPSILLVRAFPAHIYIFPRIFRGCAGTGWPFSGEAFSLRVLLKREELMARVDREAVNKSCTKGLVVDYEGSELKTFRNAMKKDRLKAALNCGEGFDSTDLWVMSLS
jgi:hypothetical protein